MLFVTARYDPPNLTTAPPTVADSELLCRVGAGAYGEVWLAHNTATYAERAVKIVYRATFSDKRPSQREVSGLWRNGSTGSTVCVAMLIRMVKDRTTE